jgi:hypothetical protein
MSVKLEFVVDSTKRRIPVKRSPEKPEEDVEILNGSCTGASGTYSAPDTGVGACYLVDKVSRQRTNGTVNSSGGQWSAQFPPVPGADYTVVAEGDTSSASIDVTCRPKPNGDPPLGGG